MVRLIETAMLKEKEYLSLHDSMLDVFVFPKEMLGECYLETDANVRRAALELLLRLCACTLSSERHFSKLIKILEAPFTEYRATLTRLEKVQAFRATDEQHGEQNADRTERAEEVEQDPSDLQTLLERLEIVRDSVQVVVTGAAELFRGLLARYPPSRSVMILRKLVIAPLLDRACLSDGSIVADGFSPIVGASLCTMLHVETQANGKLTWRSSELSNYHQHQNRRLPVVLGASRVKAGTLQVDGLDAGVSRTL